MGTDQNSDLEYKVDPQDYLVLQEGLDFHLGKINPENLVLTNIKIDKVVIDSRISGSCDNYVGLMERIYLIEEGEYPCITLEGAIRTGLFGGRLKHIQVNIIPKNLVYEPIIDAEEAKNRLHKLMYWILDTALSDEETVH